MLNGTTSEVREREALRVNPSKTCQPIGAMYAALGIHRCLPHSHGSQGCCAYHRSQLTRHYKEPVMASSSSFTEGASVFGGLSNLQTALSNIFSLYDPDVVAVHTTCLSEVIGDDIPMIIEKSRQDGIIPEGKVVIHANTPSFVGSHVTGFSSMTAAMVKYLAVKTGATGTHINLVPGWVEPADIREMRRYCDGMGIETLVFPDTSDVLDAPHGSSYDMYPRGGVTIDTLRRTGDALATIAVGEWASLAAAEELDHKCDVPYEAVGVPIGLTMTDHFVEALRHTGLAEVPSFIEEDRGRLLDLMLDMSQYTSKLRVAIFGDPDHTLAMTQFAIDLGMLPIYVITGTSSSRWERRVREIIGDKLDEPLVKSNADIHFLHQHMKRSPVDLLIGNTHGKLVARAEDNLPFVRLGFPVLDRAGHRCFPTVCYAGAMRLVEKITDALLEKRDRTCGEEWFELVY